MGERIVIASDHAAVEMKAMLVAHLQAAGHEVVDLGPGGIDSVDYPDYGYKIADAIAAGSADYGVALCGSGIGISISINRHPTCRCALVSDASFDRFEMSHAVSMFDMGAKYADIVESGEALEYIAKLGSGLFANLPSGVAKA